MSKNELAQYYYGVDYDKLPQDKREHIDTQMIVFEERGEGGEAKDEAHS